MIIAFKAKSPDFISNFSATLRSVFISISVSFVIIWQYFVSLVYSASEILFIVVK